jgi:hypothetical protein
MPGQWTTLKNKPRFNVSTMLLLNDGNVMCQDSGGMRWFLLTPDPHGDYVSGSWGLSSIGTDNRVKDLKTAFKPFSR